MIRALRPFPAFAALCCAAAVLAGGRKDAVTLQGFDGEMVNTKLDGNPLLPPAKGPVYFYPKNVFEGGAKGFPADGIVHAVAVYLSRNGYWVAAHGHADVILVVHWYPIDPEITHFGPPVQFVDLKGSGGLGLCGEDVPTHFPPFVGIVAIDFKAAQEKPARIVKLWEMALWLRIARPKGDVEIGTPEVQQYLDAVPLPPRASK